MTSHWRSCGADGEVPLKLSFFPFYLGCLGRLAGMDGEKNSTGSKKQDLKCAVKFGYPGRRGGVIATSASSWATPGGYQLLKCIAIHQNELKNRPRLDSGRRHE